MKLLISQNKVAAIANDDYVGDEFAIDAPQDFMPNYCNDYAYVDGKLSPASEVLWAVIKRIRDEKTINGGYPCAGKWFHSDILSRTQQIGLVMLGQSIPPGLEWKTMDGSTIAMTPALAAQVFAAAAAQDIAIFAHAETLRAAVITAADPSAVDLLAGWPKTFVS